MNITSKINIEPKQINLFVMATALFILVGLASYYWSVNNILLNSVPSDYVSGIGCPIYSRDCDCTGKEINRSDLESVFVINKSNQITTFCNEGQLANCKCYEDLCNDIGNQEIDCAQFVFK